MQRSINCCRVAVAPARPTSIARHRVTACGDARTQPRASRDDLRSPHRYNKIAGLVTSLVVKLKALPPDNAFRIRSTEALLTKLYNMGLVPVASSLAAAERIAASAFCRRRLPVVMVRLKFAETLREAVAFVEQGHIRVGPEVVTDPAYLVSRTFEGAYVRTRMCIRPASAEGGLSKR